MKRTLAIAALALLLAPAVPARAQPAPGIVGGGAGPRAGAGRAETPEQLFELAERQLRRGYYDEAIVNFDKVRNRFPFNQYSVLAELRVADCLFEKSSYLEAADGYRRFARLHPRDENLSYAIWRAAESELRLAPRLATRDQTHSFRALEILEDYARSFPESEFLPQARETQQQIRDRLALQHIKVGNYYQGQRAWSAAAGRYEEALTRFPNSTHVPLAYLRLARCHYRAGDLAAAQVALGRFSELGVEGRRARAAERLMERVQAAEAQAAPAVEEETLSE